MQKGLVVYTCADGSECDKKEKSKPMRPLPKGKEWYCGDCRGNWA